jgi:hypothetical protein
MAKAAENDAATTMVGQCRSSDIDRNDIIMGLTDMPSAPHGQKSKALKRSDARV